MGKESAEPESDWPLARGVTRWQPWLAAGLALGLVGLLGPWLGRRLAAPGAPGLEVLVFDNLAAEPPAARALVATTTEVLVLKDPVSSLRARAIWTVGTSGAHRLRLGSDEVASVVLDGRTILVRATRDGDAAVTERTVELVAGPHLLELNGSNLFKRGFQSLLVTGPAGASERALDDELRQPAGARAWAGFLLARRSDVLTGAGLGLLALAALLLTTRRRRIEVRAALATCVLVALPSLVVPPGPAKVPFAHAEVIAELAATRPSFVFLGNSMTGSRVDEATVEELTGREAQVIRLPGTGNAAWYLVLKNYLAVAGIAPEATILFYRDHWLTIPRRFAGDRSTFESLSPGAEAFDEPLVEELVFGTARWKAALERLVRRAVPAVTQTRPSAPLPGALALALSTSGAPAPSGSSEPGPVEARHALRTRVNERFGLDALKGRRDLGGNVDSLGFDALQRELIEADASFDFDRMVERSFLPEIVRIGSDHDLNLVFVRLRRRPDGPAPDPRLPAYLEKLERYLASAGVRHFDMSGETGITSEWYGEGDHIAEPYKQRYTELLVDRLGDLFGRRDE